jgi:hypothetical protein
VGAESDAAIKELEGKLAELESNSDWANLEIEKALEARRRLMSTSGLPFKFCTCKRSPRIGGLIKSICGDRIVF